MWGLMTVDYTNLSCFNCHKKGFDVLEEHLVCRHCEVVVSQIRGVKEQFKLPKLNPDMTTVFGAAMVGGAAYFLKNAGALHVGNHDTGRKYYRMGGRYLTARAARCKRRRVPKHLRATVRKRVKVSTV